MKKLRFIFTMLIAMLISTMAFANEGTVSPNQVNGHPKTFKRHHHGGKTFIHVVKDLFDLDDDLDDVFDDAGIKIRIGTRGGWYDYDYDYDHDTRIPVAYLPEPIRYYISTHFPGVWIYKAEREHYGYKVKLSNGLKLKFNRQGYFLRYDD